MSICCTGYLFYLQFTSRHESIIVTLSDVWAAETQIYVKLCEHLVIVYIHHLNIFFRFPITAAFRRTKQLSLGIGRTSVKYSAVEKPGPKISYIYIGAQSYACGVQVYTQSLPCNIQSGAKSICCTIVFKSNHGQSPRSPCSLPIV